MPPPGQERGLGLFALSWQLSCVDRLCEVERDISLRRIEYVFHKGA